MKPTGSARPDFSAEDAQDLVLKLWNIKGLAMELPSERDQNFQLHAGSGADYILKIANALEKKEVLELQVLAIRHLARTVRGYNWTEIIKTSSREDIATADGRGGTKHFVRLLTFLPGEFLSKAKPHSPGLLRIGIELVRDRLTLEPAPAEAAHIAERLKEKGILIGTEGPRRNVLKIRPPMVIEEADAARLLEALDQVLSETSLQSE